MGEVAGRRMMAEIEGDFVVFLIGARLSKRQVFQSLIDLGGRRGMRHMLDYLVEHPEKGLLAYEMGIPTIVQYWRRVGRSTRTGIWHETYLVKAGQYEAVYGNMPAHGLGKAGRLVPMSEASSARERLGAVTV